MRIVVIGATGHVGTLPRPAPRARRPRGRRAQPRRARAVPAGARVGRGRAARRSTATPRTRRARSASGSRRSAPTWSIDMICFTPESARQLVDALRPARPLLLHCGTIWVHGPAARVPVTEDEPRTAYGEYGTGKAAIEALLQRETLAGGVPERRAASRPHQRPRLAGRSRRPATSTPTSGGGWPTGEPLAAARPRARRAAPRARRRRRAGVRARARRGRPRSASSFHVVAEQAMTLRGLAAGVAAWFGREPVLELVDWAEFERRVGAEHAAATREHVGRSIAASIDRARAVLGYAPRYSVARRAARGAALARRQRARSTSAASRSDRARRSGRQGRPPFQACQLSTSIQPVTRPRSRWE